MTAATNHDHVPANAYPGTCRYCMCRRPVRSISRSGGGTYRRGGRSYSSSICGPCAIHLLTSADPSGSQARFSTITLARIVADIDTDDARQVHAIYAKKADAYFAEIRQRREQRTQGLPQ